VEDVGRVWSPGPNLYFHVDNDPFFSALLPVDAGVGEPVGPLLTCSVRWWILSTVSARPRAAMLQQVAKK
jgi:hypothetical protein